MSAPRGPGSPPPPPPLTACPALCLLSLSLFILSNETVNIWSHLLGFLLFFTLGIYDLTAVLPAAGASREDFVICSVCLFCFQVGAGSRAVLNPSRGAGSGRSGDSAV